MKILYLSPYIPTRIRVRTFNLIKELASQHDIHVISLDDIGNGHNKPGIDELAGMVSSLQIIKHNKLNAAIQAIMALPTLSPMCTSYCRSASMNKAINDFLSKNKVDVIHIEHLRAAHFHPRNKQIPVILDSVDCLSSLFKQMSRSDENSIVTKLKLNEEAWKLNKYEPKVLENFDHITVTTNSEKQELLNRNPKLDITVVPNGVDIDYFKPMGKIRTPGRIVFSGKMSYSPNAQAAIWFATNIMPAIRKKHPLAQFIVIGSNPPPEVEKLVNIPGVKITGYLPDIRTELDSCSIAIAPMLVAAGIQNKILEAMSMELPVVASNITLKAFDTYKEGIIGTESANEMIRTISELIESPEKAELIGMKGRKTVCHHYSWSDSASIISTIYSRYADIRKT